MMFPARFAALISGGLDSAILVGEALRRGAIVHPVFVRFGLAWEETECAHLVRYLEKLSSPALHSLKVLHQPVADLYGDHWSVTGVNVPDERSPDEAVFLLGRNLLLLSKAMLWCHTQGIPAITLGSLQTNPFPDATPGFFAAMERTVNLAVGFSVPKVERHSASIVLPFAGMKKVEVMRFGADLPLEETFSCIQPRHGLHCGRCNKCAERRHAFEDTAMTDPTRYASV